MKAQVQKESQKRNMGKKLNRLLAQEPGKNPFALELGLKGKSNNEKADYVYNESDWELVEDPGQRPYYWNRVTHQTTYDDPAEFGVPKPPPPPPPKMLLAGLPGMVPPPPAAPAAAQVAEEQEEEEVPAPAKSSWVYVCRDEPNPYYWNMETNETSFEPPEAWDGTIYGEESSSNAQEGEAEAEAGTTSQIIWQEQLNENGEYVYYNTVDESYSTERPVGQVIIAVIGEDGSEVNWQEYYQDEEVAYMNLTTGEVVTYRPEGTTLILQSV